MLAPGLSRVGRLMNDEILRGTSKK